MLLAIGDGFESVLVGDEFRRDALGVCDLLQQDLQELDRGAVAPAIVAPVPLDLGKALRVAGEAALHGGQHVDAEPRLVHATRHRPEVAERIEGLRCRGRDFEQGVVFEDAGSGHVTRLGFRFAPGRDLHQHGEVAWPPNFRAEPFPGILGMLLIGGGGGEGPHLVGEPAGPSGTLELLYQSPVDVAQMGHVGQSVCDLGLRQRPASPVREPR